MESNLAGADGEREAPHKPIRRGRGRPSLSDEALLDKAFELFLEHGFDGTRIEQITAAAGMAKRTLYARYKDKSALFRAALERAIDDWIGSIDDLSSVETDDLEETLLNVARILVASSTSLKGQQLLRLSNAESSRHPEIGNYAFRRRTEFLAAYLADLFQRHIDAEHAPAEGWSATAYAFLNAVVFGPSENMARGVTNDRGRLERLVPFYVRLFIYGLAPRNSASSPIVRSKPGEAERCAHLEAENRMLRDLLAQAILDKKVLEISLSRGKAEDPAAGQ